MKKNSQRQLSTKGGDNFYHRIYGMVKVIPPGKVATYGQIAALAGSPRGARMVGWALHVLSDEQLVHTPWHRVINREGRISTTCFEHTCDEQALLLKKEGVIVRKSKGNYWIDLKQFQWKV